MFKEKIYSSDQCSATVTRGSGHNEGMSIHGNYSVVCYDTKGDVKWEDKIENLVTNIGKCLTLDLVLANTGTINSSVVSALGTGIVVMGLKGNNAVATITDTQSSHTWNEVGGVNAPAYSGSNRKYVNLGVANTSTNTKTTGTNAVVFNMTSSGTVSGCFINIGSSNTAVDNTAGTLFSVGDFTGGSKTVASGDTLSVTYTASA